ncbi:MAG TPA: hypothetical protein VJY35_03840, partial [Candidatus Eisenbacteria bacterium]|nr:hypothetical protein [Candidatus Eisenbacteria bacterium]
MAIGPMPTEDRPPDPPSDPPEPPQPIRGPAGGLPPRVWILLALGALMVVLGPRTCARRAARTPGAPEAPRASTR